MTDYDEPPTPAERIPFLLGSMVLMNRAAGSLQDELGECLRVVLADGETMETLAGRLDLSPEQVRRFASEPPEPAIARLGISEAVLDRIAAAHLATPVEECVAAYPEAGADSSRDEEQKVERFRELLEDATPEDFA